ncbi:MAG TPA: amylo-alpha-1,6-glucosidase [Chloroflexota bacterium]|nr:amylo-alpha-1,6-glucosidase [Chloroflexota bacterium]
MTEPHMDDLDIGRLLGTLASVIDRETVETRIGRILMPGPTYLGIWARDTGVASLGINRLGKTDLSGELLRRYWSYQITPQSDPARFVFRNKRFAEWTEDFAYRPTREELLREVGAFPTSVYIHTPEFPAGTREIYTNRADPDSCGWLIIALQDHCVHSGDDTLVHELAPAVSAAIAYLRSRDDDGDHLLEQGANEDWADTLLRRGKVAYTQAVWYHALEAASKIFATVGDEEQSEACRREQEDVRLAANRILMTPEGYYANYVETTHVSLRRSLDTALLVAFQMCGREEGRRAMTILDSLDGPFGTAVIEPGYFPDQIGPSKTAPGQYHNEGIWPWITAYQALGWARIGERQRARDVILSLFRTQPSTVHEWIDNLNGEAHHPDFATAAGALAWVITEAGLDTEEPIEPPTILS